MEVKIQISDAVYAQLLNGSNRIEGSIGLISPKKGNFNAYSRRSYRDSRTKFMKLPHGRVSMNDKHVRLNLKIDYAEQVVPSHIIETESYTASSFIDLMEELS